MLQKQVEHEAKAMGWKAHRYGWNGHFDEFVPVRYAEQLVAGTRFFIKVRVQQNVFIDIVVLQSFSSSDGKPTLEGVRFDVDGEAPSMISSRQQKYLSEQIFSCSSVLAVLKPRG